MATVDLTSEPAELTLNLTRDSDFVRALVPSGEGFPTDAQIILDFGPHPETEQPQTWAAEVTAERAQWNVDKVMVNELIANKPRTAKLRYVHNQLDLLWAIGSVTIDG